MGASIKNETRYKIERFLYENGGVVISFDNNAFHPVLDEKVSVIKSVLKRLLSAEHLLRQGNWLHNWYFVTEKGSKYLKDKVGLPSEARDLENKTILN